MLKIDHFHWVHFQPLHSSRCSKGTHTLIGMPNVVRNMVAGRITKQYISYCNETGFTHLSGRELYRVLQYCPAQQKIAPQGLDNISTDGLCGVEKLEDVRQRVIHYSLQNEQCDNSHELVCSDSEHLYLLEILIKNVFSNYADCSLDEKKTCYIMCKYPLIESTAENIIY